MLRRAFVLLIPLTACASDDSACEQAAAHLAACFPEHSTAPVCDPATADTVANMPCDELAAWDGKADNPWCFWTPWLCTGSSGTSGKKIEVAVDECGPGGLCPYVQSAACGLVTLHDGHDKEVARGFTSGGGRLTFENIAAGTYTVKVHKRDGSLARMMVSDYTDQTGPAKSSVELASSGDAPWARFNLPNGTADAITQCADARGNVTFTDAHGHVLDRHDAEWNWLVELETDGATELTRPLFIYPDSNIVMFRLLSKGTHTLRYYRMDIPASARTNNPDYERLKRLYSTNEAPVEQTVTVTAAQVGKQLDISRKVVDPLAP